tara:strand:+ start:828 stop:1043 length:216 start_codon:yes stop_codon:yes gene_type:complete
METINIGLFLVLALLSFPITHILMKKGMIMDYNITEEKQKNLSKFFYIPYLNVIVSFFYLILVIIRFKRPD